MSYQLQKATYLVRQLMHRFGKLQSMANQMHTFLSLFNEFSTSSDALRVYKGNKLLFASNKDGLLPLLEYTDRFPPYHRQVVIFDKIIGNAAALLCIKAGCQEVYSPLASQLAIVTLDRYGIKYHFTRIVPYIQNTNGKDMCPMEKLSINKEPEEFHKAIKSIINKGLGMTKTGT